MAVQTRQRSAADLLRVYEYCGARLAVAELMGAVDFGSPQRIARTLGPHHSERQAFLKGVLAAYRLEATPPALKAWSETTNGWAKRFYSDLCRSAAVS